MANIPSVAKRARQSVKRHTRNTAVLSSLKTAKRKVREAITAGNAEEAQAAYSKLNSVLDKAAKRGVIHANVAKRGKSRLKKALTAASSSKAPAKAASKPAADKPAAESEA